MKENNPAISSPLGECVFLMPEGYEDENYFPSLIKNADPVITELYKSGKEASVSVTPQQYNSVSFCGEHALVAVRIPDGEAVIAPSRFEDCIFLRSITIPDSVELIEKYAFMSCESLEELILPDGLRVVRECSFACCKGLKELVFPDGTEEIDAEAMKGCDSLERLSVPASVKSFKEITFAFLPSLKEICFRGSREQWERIFVPARVPLRNKRDIVIVFDKE